MLFSAGLFFFVSYFSPSSLLFLAECTLRMHHGVSRVVNDARIFLSSISFASAHGVSRSRKKRTLVTLSCTSRASEISFVLDILYIREIFPSFFLSFSYSFFFCLSADKRILLSVVCFSLLNMNSSILITREFFAFLPPFSLSFRGRRISKLLRRVVLTFLVVVPFFPQRNNILV